ncbi:MAG: cobalt-precorrin-2 C(20)-methyltransferase [Clostridia bacterium BRH_c25]|nr:MAG: cobalt-precorrin-2 C(20)-methyltransferase [Clostridia bacterium BRH_c25]
MKMIYGIGVGPGDKELITLKAYRIIRTCDCVFIPESKGDSLAGIISHEYIKDKKVVELSFPMKEDNQLRYKQAAQTINEVLKDDEAGVFLTLGDPMTYSTYSYLMKELADIKITTETIPGITSFNAAASVLGLPVALRDESFYMADGNIDEEILKRVDTVCILKVSKDKENIIGKLEQYGFSYAYVKRCTQAGQKIIYDRQEMLEDNDYMSLIFARKAGQK